MANDNAVVTWDPNSETDLAGYTVYWGMVSGHWTSADITTLTTMTISSSQFSSDGVWYFAVDAFDTSNQNSATATPVSKRIVRVASKFKLRR